MDEAERATGRDGRRERDAFASRWRLRFEAFANARDDDAGIAGWSITGLETRFRGFCRLCKSPPSGTAWLDVGCGAGTYSAWLAGHGAVVTGLDYSLSTLHKARERLPTTIALCAGDASALPFPRECFDGALCFGVLQAVSDSGAVVREIARVLKPGGTLWIDALNGEAVHTRWREWRRQRAGRPPHLRYESPQRLVATMRESGFDDVAHHWLPIAPSSWQVLQPWLESTVARDALATLPGAGELSAHSVLIRGTRTAAADS